jgi:hypothetical protein
MKVISGRAGTWCILMLLAAASVFAGQGVVSIAKVGGLRSGTTVNAGANVRFVIKFTNDLGEKCDVANGFKVSSPDGAFWDSTTIDSIGPINNGGTPGDPTDDFNDWFNKYFDVAFGFLTYSGDGHGEDTVGCLAAGAQNKTTRQLPASWNDTVFAVTAWFNGNKASAGKHICIDSSYFPPGGTWLWVGKSLNEYHPAFQGLTVGQSYSDGLPSTRTGSGYCFDIYAPTLVVTPAQLNFTALANGTPPANQTFTVTSTGDGSGDFQNFTLTENSVWIIKSPVSGTTPKTITVSINQTGLVPGTYLDSIQVSSSTSANSPQWIKIGLTVTAPSPTISLSASSLSFIGVTSGPNPAPQSFIVKNTGGGTLNWSAAKGATWLTLSPGSGIDSGLVSVSVDNTGLLQGTYTDTIYITDPAATNSPKKVVVTFSLGSNLPFIVVDSQVNHIIVDSHIGGAPNRNIVIRNGGVGALTFTLSESSPRLFTVTPSSGSAPQTVSVGFKLVGYVNGNTFKDTLWVTSPEATNSPYPVVFQFRIVDTPAVITLNKDTLQLTTFECSSGATLPSDSFTIFNAGGDNPMNFQLVYQTSLATVSQDNAQAPYQIIVDAANINPPLGTYYDTILVTSLWAINSPQMVIIKYSRIAGIQQPVISVAQDSFVVIRQEQTGNVLLSDQVQNLYEGCMPWTLSESIPWLTAPNPSGNVPGNAITIVDVDGLTRGQYRDSFYINAPSAANSPKKIQVTVKMWKLHGDNNWDGFINIADLARLVAYLAGGGPSTAPMPEYIVGDMNCSGVVDLADLSILVAYLSVQNPIICGNP